MNEQDIIQHFISQQKNNSVICGIGDDCAILNPSSDCQLVTTTDTLVEGRHFVKSAPAYEVGFKLMATNLSDIASMCATPKWATLNLTLTEYNQTWVSDFASGLLDCANEHDVSLVGGDTTLGEQLMLSVQLIGEVPVNAATLRSNAKIGDVIYVTGEIGSAAHALKVLSEKNYQHELLDEEQITALYRPASRVNLALELRPYIHACIDISDGLLHELEIICAKSGRGAEINMENIPIVREVELLNAVTFGDDYELLFTVDPLHSESIIQAASRFNCQITAIGHIINSDSVKLKLHGQTYKYPEVSGYDHFTQSK